MAALTVDESRSAEYRYLLQPDPALARLTCEDPLEGDRSGEAAKFQDFRNTARKALSAMNTFQSRSKLTSGSREYTYYSLPAVCCPGI